MALCPVCYSYLDENSRQIPYPSDNREGKKNISFSSIVFCNNCELGIAFPEISKDRLVEFYNNGNFGECMNMKSLSLKSLPGYFALARSRWSDIERLLIGYKNNPHIKILDIGAGYGCIGLVANQSKRIELDLYTCIEPDLLINQYLKNNLNSLLGSQKFETKHSIDEVNGQYDVVVLSHVLEHINDPLSMIRSAVLLLAQGGILLLDVPNRDYLFKKDVFPHILFFSLETIRYMLSKEGLIEVALLEGRGSDIFHLHPSKKAYLKIRLATRFVQIFYRFLPGKFLVEFFSWYFGVNRINPDGAWIRALCRKKIYHETI